MNILADTIAALATPPGESGIAVIRVSGPDAITICDMRFRGKKSLRNAAGHTAHFGFFTDRHETKMDEVVVTVFLGPHSYTAEDVVEISCHGGSFVSSAILGEIVAGGARAAEPGEFTKRAFLNGRIDLSQAEAVADLIRARSRLAHQTSIEQLSGRISRRVSMLREQIVDLASLIELELDFSEEGIDLLKKDELLARLEDIELEIRGLLATYQQGQIIKNGVRVVLAGRPNVGKSSILNSLLMFDRAIVSEIPGTTRDTLEESISIDGLLFTLTDTAGLRKSSDNIEELGVERAKAKLGSADIIIFVLDASDGLTNSDGDLLRLFENELKKEHARLLIVENKIDLSLKPGATNITGEKFKDMVRISAKTGEGTDTLRARLLAMASLNGQNTLEGSPVITSQRHEACLSRALQFVQTTSKMAGTASNSELIADNLQMSIKALGEIVGIVTTEDLLHNIFSQFCIGK